MSQNQAAKKSTALAVQVPGSQLLNRIDTAVAHSATAFEEMTKAIRRAVSTSDSEALPYLYRIVNGTWKKAVESQRDAIREALVEMAEEVGKSTPDNPDALCFTATYGDCDFETTVQHPRESKPNAGELRRLLEEKGLKMEDACDVTISYVVNMTKLNELINSKRLTEAEVDKCRLYLSPRVTVEKL